MPGRLVGNSARRSNHRSPRRTHRPRLEILERREVLSSFVVTSGSDSGPGSFRDAIQKANASAGADDISFDLGSVGDTIRVETNLPAVTDSVTISSPVRIALTWKPTNAAVGSEALSIRADDVHISNLSITGFEHAVVLHDGADRAVISNNYLGVALDGETAPGGMFHGVRIGASTGDIIENNVIAGASRESIWVESPNASGNVIRGNKIGTNAAGTSALGNLSDGIHLGVGSHHNTITGNLISGNAGSGIRISDAYDAAAHDNVVQGNRIGTDVTGNLPIPNGTQGVLIVGAASDNLIGGRGAGLGNIIAFNTLNGVQVLGAGAARNTIVGNSIRSNGLLGIDLGDDGVTPNDSLDADGFLNAPVIASVATTGGGTTEVQGVYDGSPNQAFTIDFYANPGPTSGQQVQGARYLGSLSVTTDSLGHAAFDGMVPSSATANEYVTVTASAASGGTSEFSPAVVVTQTKLPPVGPEPPPPVDPGTGPIQENNEYVYVGGTYIEGRRSKTIVLKNMANAVVRVEAKAEDAVNHFVYYPFIVTLKHVQRPNERLTLSELNPDGAMEFRAVSNRDSILVTLTAPPVGKNIAVDVQIFIKQAFVTNLSVVRGQVTRNANGGVHFDYQVDAEGVPANYSPKYSVYLVDANGVKLKSLVANRPLAKSKGQYPVDIPAATVKTALKSQPTAKKFLVEIDGAGLPERNQNDNKAFLELPNIKVVSAKLASDGGVDVIYKVEGNNGKKLPHDINPVVSAAWAKGDPLKPIPKSKTASKPINKNNGESHVHFSPADLGTKPAGATGISVVFDPKFKAALDESDETDNNASVEFANNFTLDKIPDIETARGWTNGARLLTRWFNGKAALAPNYTNPPEPIDMDWVLSYIRSGDALIRLTLDYYGVEAPNYPIERRLRQSLVERAKAVLAESDATTASLTDFQLASIDEKGVRRANQRFHDASQVGFRKIEPYLINPFGDDLLAALGNFSLYAAPIGTATRTGNSITVSITKIAVYVRDSFDFNGAQAGGLGLGNWMLPNGFSLVRLPGYNHVDNSNFRNYRTRTGDGADFVVFSDFRMVEFVAPIKFTFTANG